MVSVSSTTRFTPKAPGFSRSKICQQEGKKLSGNAHILSLSKVRPSSKPPLVLLTSLQRAEQVSLPHFADGGNGPEGRLRRPLKIEPQPISLGLILQFFPPPHASPICGEDSRTLQGAAKGLFTLALCDPSFQHPPPNWASKQESNWSIISAIIGTAIHVPGTVPSTFHAVSTTAISVFTLEELRSRELGPSLRLQH